MTELIIDILIPIYKSNKEYLRSSILSLKNQTTKNNIICILNGMDHNQNEKYTKLLKELKVDLVVECPFNGVAEALNYGFAFTKSEFIARQDDDDISHPDRLYLQYQYMKKNSVDVLGTNIKVINHLGKIIGKREYPQKDHICKQNLIHKTCFAHPSVMMRRQFMINNPYPSTKSEDYALWLKANTNYVKYANLPIYLYSWRRHPNQASNKSIPYLYLKKSICLIKKENSLNLKLYFVFLLFIRIFICLIKGRKIDIKTTL